LKVWVRPPEHFVLFEDVPYLGQIALRNPGCQQLADLSAAAPPVALLAEVEAEAGLQLCKAVGQ